MKEVMILIRCYYSDEVYIISLYYVLCKNAINAQYLCIPWNHYDDERSRLLLRIYNGSTTREWGKWGATWEGGNVKDNNETETNFNRSGVRENTDHRGENIIQVWHQRMHHNYYNGSVLFLLVVIINSRKMCSMMHRNSVKLRINIRSTTITRLNIFLYIFFKPPT